MMGINTVTELDTRLLSRAFYGGFEYLNLNYKLLDNLNVFPIPDGDTGVNMLLTIKPSAETIFKQETRLLSDMLKQFKEDVINNSRGNSGFILSRFFSGFSSTLIEESKITAETLQKAFLKGAYDAKVSLMAPAEGTMITIISEMSKTMTEAENKDIISLFSEALIKADEILYKTPEMLPILAKAGVVDAGALGFIFIIRGMLLGLTGGEMIEEDENKYRFSPDKTIVNDLEEIKYRYCTEVIAEMRSEFVVDNFKYFLQAMGDSIALLFEKELLKIHIHTNEPQMVLEKIAQHGTIVKDKIEDMEHQVSLKNDIIVEESYSILSIVPGEGFIEVFSDLGVGHFLIYDSLPSVMDISVEINLIKSDNIILLPNNNNIIPAALQVQKDSDKNIAVVLTKNIVQGISALYGYTEYETFKNNINSMNENIDLSICLKANLSAMDIKYGDDFIKENDYFITTGDDVLATGKNLKSVVIKALEGFDLSERANITLYYNESIEVEALQEVKDEILKIYQDIEVEVLYGGQKKSPVIIAIE